MQLPSINPCHQVSGTAQHPRHFVSFPVLHADPDLLKPSQAIDVWNTSDPESSFQGLQRVQPLGHLYDKHGMWMIWVKSVNPKHKRLPKTHWYFLNRWLVRSFTQGLGLSMMKVSHDITFSHTLVYFTFCPMSKQTRTFFSAEAKPLKLPRSSESSLEVCNMLATRSNPKTTLKQKVHTWLATVLFLFFKHVTKNHTSPIDLFIISLI